MGTRRKGGGYPTQDQALAEAARQARSSQKPRYVFLHRNVWRISTRPSPYILQEVVTPAGRASLVLFDEPLDSQSLLAARRAARRMDRYAAARKGHR